MFEGDSADAFATMLGLDTTDPDVAAAVETCAADMSPTAPD
jgi:hypothetical protein